ncbi:hypothetical protein CHCC19467_2508 [Bacillus paralicheniformis]|nr:hypothetical protein CHCC19467_2508 [Bacillus paralicheniformis]
MAVGRAYLGDQTFFTFSTTVGFLSCASFSYFGESGRAIRKYKA